MARRLQKRARRYLEGHDDANALLDPDDEEATLQHALSSALRPPVRPQRALLPGLDEDPEPPPPSPLCVRVAGYSLHAARTVPAHDRAALERLCRYGLRAPFSQRRLSYLPDGRVHYRLARPWPTPSGVTDLVLEPVQFLKRLAALIPPPYQNQTRYHGCFANRSRFRKRLPPPPPTEDNTAPQLSVTLAEDEEAEPEPEPELIEPNEPRPRRLAWARLLKRSLGVDGLQCPACHAQMLVIALITKPDVITKILEHLRLPSTPPPVAPARQHPEHAQVDLIGIDQHANYRQTANTSSETSNPLARAPP